MDFIRGRAALLVACAAIPLGLHCMNIATHGLMAAIASAQSAPLEAPWLEEEEQAWPADDARDAELRRLMGFGATGLGMLMLSARVAARIAPALVRRRR
ncbi:MAG TPA: hypothetical protein VN680_09470 [Burkholderiaceae bacterium]|jgi:hypothetical protein|nr:hypothetical protein [Burkholderiaceae bacterium]